MGEREGSFEHTVRAWTVGQLRQALVGVMAARDRIRVTLSGLPARTDHVRWCGGNHDDIGDCVIERTDRLSVDDRRAEKVAAAFAYGNDWTRLAAIWDLCTHHGPRETWPVLRDEFLRALGVGPNLPWHHAPTTSGSNPR